MKFLFGLFAILILNTYQVFGNTVESEYDPEFKQITYILGENTIIIGPNGVRTNGNFQKYKSSSTFIAIAANKHQVESTDEHDEHYSPASCVKISKKDGVNAFILAKRKTTQQISFCEDRIIFSKQHSRSIMLIPAGGSDYMKEVLSTDPQFESKIKEYASLILR